MKLPADAIIDRAKLTRYLLVPKPKNDKSRFLAQAGFTQANPAALEDAIRRLIAQEDAGVDRQDQWGTFYQVVGTMQGPRGTLRVVTVWIEHHADGVIRFVTLKPARG